MPQKFIDLSQKWVDLHPTWVVKWWHDHNLFPMKNQQEFDAITDWSGKSNILRYEVLQKEGGVYLDTDFLCLRNIEPLLENISCFVGELGEDRLSNAFMGCTPNHPYINEVIKGLVDWNKEHPDLPDYYKSGSQYINDVHKKIYTRSDVTVYPFRIFTPIDFNDREKTPATLDLESFPSSYAIHLWENGWSKEVR